MGQKVNPIGFRLAVTEPWRSRWYATKANFAAFILEDKKIRTYILKNCQYAAIPKVEIPTGKPLVYELDKDLKPIRHYYLDEKAARPAAG